MNRIAVAQELVRIAEMMTAIDFDTQDAFDKYMKEHPDADKSNHKVVEKKEEPAKKDAPAGRVTKWGELSTVMEKHSKGWAKPHFDKIDKLLKQMETSDVDNARDIDKELSALSGGLYGKPAPSWYKGLGRKVEQAYKSVKDSRKS